MNADNAIRQSATAILGRVKALPLSDKIATILGLVIGLLFCAVVIAGLGTHAAREAAEDMKSRHLPFLETALGLEALIYEAVYHSSMFGISDDMASYSGARIGFASIRTEADRLANQATAIPEMASLTRDMERLRDLAHKLDTVVEKKRTLNDERAQEQTVLQKTAGDMGDILLDLQAALASASTPAGTGKENENLDEKARLLVINGFSLAVAEITGRVLAAGVAKNAEDMVKAQTVFTLRWKEARDACFAAAGLPASGGTTPARVAENPGKEMERLVAAFAGSLGAIRFNLEESARVTGDRADTTSRLLSLTRGILAVARGSIADAADRTDTALRGATATIFACALLACILAVGAAFAFARRASSSTTANQL